MKSDNYTKIILTIIAINLSFISLSKLEVIPTAKANDKTSYSSGIPAPNYKLVPVNPDGTVPVSLSSNSEIDVNIIGISTTDELDVNIDEVGGGYVSHGGPIPVEID